MIIKSFKVIVHVVVEVVVGLSLEEDLSLKHYTQVDQNRRRHSSMEVLAAALILTTGM